MHEIENSKSIKNIEHDAIWFDHDLLIDLARRIGLNDFAGHDVYSYDHSPCSYAIYISTDKEQWESFREALVYCLIRKLFIRQGWIKPNQKLSSQTEWKEADYRWMDRWFSFMGDLTDGCGNIVCKVFPHRIDISDLDFSEEFNLFFTDDELLEEGEYRASAHDIRTISNSVMNGDFISVYWDSYDYSQLYFGITDHLYILIGIEIID